MNEEIEYAEMLEIPVSTVNVVRKKRIKKKPQEQRQTVEEADLNVLDINNNYMMFERINNENEILVAVSRSNYENKIYIPKKYESSDLVYTLKRSCKKSLDSYGGIAIKRK